MAGKRRVNRKGDCSTRQYDTTVLGPEGTWLERPAAATVTRALVSVHMRVEVLDEPGVGFGNALPADPRGLWPFDQRIAPVVGLLR
jgi:hypothetical protein